MNEWMTEDFVFFSTILKSYQDCGRIIIKMCATTAHLRLKRFPPLVGIEFENASKSVMVRLFILKNQLPSDNILIN